MIILIDTRESKPLEFDHGFISGTKKIKLDTGDYGAKFKDGFIAPVFFERKSMVDLYGTLSQGYKRFKKEINRAKDNKVVLLIIIEGTLTSTAKGIEHSTREPKEIIAQLFTLFVKYGVIPVFCKDRIEMAEYITQFYIAVGKKHMADIKSDRK